MSHLLKQTTVSLGFLVNSDRKHQTLLQSHQQLAQHYADRIHILMWSPQHTKELETGLSDQATQSQSSIIQYLLAQVSNHCRCVNNGILLTEDHETLWNVVYTLYSALTVELSDICSI